MFNLLERFMKEDVLEKVTSTVKLVQLDLTNNSSLHKDTSAVDVGFVANKLLHSLKHTHTKRFLPLKDFYSVKADTKTFLIAVVKTFLLKAPIRYGLVRNLAWLHPLEICGNQDRCLQHLSRCHKIVTDAQQVNLSKCDKIIKQYEEFARENSATVEKYGWTNFDCPEIDQRPSQQCWRGHQSIVE